MHDIRWGASPTATAVLFAIVGLCCSGAAAQTRWTAHSFPHIELTTHRGERVYFDELLAGKTVAIELMYTTCHYSCPLETARLAQVQELLGDRMGRDVFFYSITIDPEHDTPAVLNAFAEQYHAGRGWIFLTGRAADIEHLSKKLGLYSPPNPDDLDGHVPTLLIGNEAMGQWMHGSALDNPRLTAMMITSWVGGYPAAAPLKSYADAPAMPTITAGQYVFVTKCSACHTLGGGDKVGPDLKNVTRVRDPQWLANYIAGPDEMLRAGDPIAKALFAKYQERRMPNLELGDQQILDVIAFLDRDRPAAVLKGAATGAGRPPSPSR